MPIASNKKKTNEDLVYYWIVKVGKLFYAGGLGGLSEDNKNKSYEFVVDQDYAFALLDEDIAKRIAIETGGILINKQGSVKELIELRENCMKRIHNLPL